MSQIKGFKLVSGEEIIATVDEAASSEILVVIEKVRSIQLSRLPSGQVGPVLMPWSLSAADGAKFPLKATDFIGEPFEVSADADKAYRQETTSLQLV